MDRCSFSTISSLRLRIEFPSPLTQQYVIMLKTYPIFERSRLASTLLL